MIKFLKEFDNWMAKQPRTHRILITIFSLAWMLFMSYRALSIRIEKTGWEYFPATLLDWFAIIGSAGFLSLCVAGIIGIGKLFKGNG